MSKDAPTLRSISAQQRTVLPGPPGAQFVREQYIDEDGVWMGIVTTQPGMASPWHHHGRYATYVYMLEGEATVEFGDGGKQRVVARADDSLHIVSAGVVHREINTGDVPNRIFVVRVGEGPPVFPVDAP